MSAIKDLVDLVTQLDASRFDARTLDAVLPIKKAALEVERESFRLERQHSEEMDKLKTEHRDAMARLEMENAKLRAKQSPTPEAKFNTETGTWFDASSDIHYCPRCWQDKKPSPMQCVNHGWRCPSCDKFSEDPANPTPASIPSNEDDDNWKL